MGHACFLSFIQGVECSGSLIPLCLHLGFIVFGLFLMGYACFRVLIRVLDVGWSWIWGLLDDSY